jgi:hypothetical protein
MMGEREFQKVADDTKKLLEQLKARDPLGAQVRSTSVPSRGDHQLQLNVVRIDDSNSKGDNAKNNDARGRSNSKDK